MSLITLLIVILIIAVVCGYAGVPTARAWGGGVALPGVGTILIILLVLYLLGVLR